jgi:hypothetical protein
MRHSSTLRGIVLATALLAVAACATPPKVHVQSDPAVQLTSYRTYGFVADPGTNRAGYSTFVTAYFKTAVRREMDARGYQFVESNPDLLINFNANAREVTEVRTTPSPRLGLGFGYYGYRDGLYGWGAFSQRDIDTDRYKIGTANVDVVDAGRKEMVWEGVVEGRLSESAMKNPQSAIDSAVAEMFKAFPGKPQGA